MPVLRTMLVFFLLLGFVVSAELRTLSGKKMSGELVSFDGKQLVLKTESGEVSTPLADLLNIDLQPGVTLTGLKYSNVLLADGSLLHCKELTIKGKQVEVTVLPNLPAKFPLSAVRYLLTDAHDAKNRSEWQEFLGKQKGNRDVLCIKRDDVLNGLEGTFLDADAAGQTIEFELSSGRKVPASVAKIHGMVIRPTGQENRPDPVCKVHDTHKNLLVAASVAVGETGATVTTLAGVKIDYPSKTALSRLDFAKGRLEYLSDLEPVTVEVSSSEDRIEKYRKDKNLDDGPLRLAGKTTNDLARQPYPKGLVLLANTVLVYNIGGDYREFKAVLGCDAQSGGDSQARIVIEGDGRELYSGQVRRKEDPRSIAVDIKGVKLLRIVVTAELLDLGNHVVLADAKVSK